jgi:type I restriction enzyme M protein
MTNETFKDIEKLETDLWEAADNLRANSKLTSSDYFMPVLGVIFLRHAANRFKAAKGQIEEAQANGKMPKRKVLPADYLRRRALWLPEKARYDWIMQQAATSGIDLPRLVTEAMMAIEADFEPLQGVLPKDYGIFETKVLEDLMRLFNSEQIRQATGDVFGRIYEYFLAKFSIQKAHDNGEFFTPPRSCRRSSTSSSPITASWTTRPAARAGCSSSPATSSSSRAATPRRRSSSTARKRTATRSASPR